MKDWHWILLGIGAVIALGAWANYAEHPTAKNLEKAVIGTLTL